MRKSTAIVILLSSLISSGGLVSCKKINSDNKLDSDNNNYSDYVGGPCSWEDDPVTITVKKIETRKENKNSSGNSEMVIVEYELTFNGGIERGRVEVYETLITPEEAKEKDVKIGKQFHASVSRIVSGTCNPKPIYPKFQEWK